MQTMNKARDCGLSSHQVSRTFEDLPRRFLQSLSWGGGLCFFRGQRIVIAGDFKADAFRFRENYFKGLKHVNIIVPWL